MSADLRDLFSLKNFNHIFSQLERSLISVYQPNRLNRLNIQNTENVPQWRYQPIKIVHLLSLSILIGPLSEVHVR